VTGLPLRLVEPGVEMTELSKVPFHNPFCEKLSSADHPCAACLLSQRKLTGETVDKPATRECFAGLCESSVPVRIGEETVAFLLTGQVATHRLTRRGFSEVVGQLVDLGVEVDEAELRESYFKTPVMTPEQYASVLGLLAIFAGHLSMIAGEMVLHGDDAESSNISRARKFIEDHLAEPLDLKTVADHAHLSSCYFCKRFKNSTGFTFTEYVARIRVEAAKVRLANRQTRVSEVAYDVGFQSLTHFNRVFREVTGQSPTQYPTQYREGLPRA
jgi:AraC-like DNA-binding protein/ligand-binding sensor protein